MSLVPAWLMQIDRMSRVALGQLELVHIIPSPEYVEIPKSHDFCKRVVLWNKKIIPVMDISMLVNKVPAYVENNAVAIAIYRDANSDAIKYGGIQLTDMPVLEKVDNSQAVSKAELPEKWNGVSISCFKLVENEVVPVLDVCRLFSTGISSMYYQ